MNDRYPTDQGVPTVHVVVSCKSRKTAPVPPALAMSSIRAHDLKERASNWISALERVDAVPHRARDLYAGDHWRVVLGIPEAAAGGLNIQLWVASAGYGLVRINTLLKPYTATFIRAHAESVLPKQAAFTVADWWQELGNWSPEAGLPRRIADLARDAETKNSFVLLALSEPYAAALSRDIVAAAQLARDRVGLVAVGLDRSATELSPALPVEARLKRIVGGAMQGINARIAHKIVTEHRRWFPSADGLKALVSEWARGVDALPTFNRDRMADEELRSFIVEQVRATAQTSKSNLLRRLRDSGRACEQARFGRLYKEVVGSAGGPTVVAERGTEA